MNFSIKSVLIKLTSFLIKNSLLNKAIYISIFAIFFFSAKLSANNKVHEHAHSKNEFGIAHSSIFFVKEKAFAYGAHLHYLRYFPESKFGLGLGYEKIFDEHNHNIAGIIFSYKPYEKLSLAVSPGIAFEEKFSELSFAVHFETTYELEFKHFHFGPVLGIAHDSKDLHLSLGVHLGYGF